MKNRQLEKPPIPTTPNKSISVKKSSDEAKKMTEKSTDILNDSRFAHLVRDPRFKSIHNRTRNVKVDKRFASMFDDKKFQIKYTIDKYGRPVKQSSGEDLKKYYELEGADESKSEDEDNERAKEEAEIVAESIGNDDLELDETLSGKIKSRLSDLTIDYARGEGKILSDSSSSEEETDDEADELFVDHVWGELDREAPRTDESTNRLAACNLDWDRIRAADIMVLCNSFLPPGGSVLSVTIYPSEYGKERMAAEEVKGPEELVDRKKDSEDDLSDDSSSDERNADDTEEGTDYNMEKLRQYQLNRLKYYYAVIECDKMSTADKLYAECDGLEYESTATKLDLRFIPDDMTFDDDPKDRCTEMPDLMKYKPRLFKTTALQQAKVELTWDENDYDRKELNEKLVTGKLNEIPDDALRNYVAYSSEESEPDSDGDIPKDGTDDERSEKIDQISKYKALLIDINKKEDEQKNSRIEMEYEWGIGVKDKRTERTIENQPNINPFEKILEKKKEKKRERKLQRKAAKKQREKGSDGSSDDDIPDGVDMNDPYFAEEFADGEWSSGKMKQSKNRKKKSTADLDSDGEKQNREELELLVDDGIQPIKHFSLKKIQSNETETKSKKKRKKRKPIEKDDEIDSFNVNVNDNRFSAIYSSHLFNIDPTDPNFKKTRGMDQLIGEKLKRRHWDDEGVTGQLDPVDKKPRQDVGVNVLVKSLKRKIGEQKSK